MDLKNLRNLEMDELNFSNDEEEERLIHAPKWYFRDYQNLFEFYNEFYNGCIQYYNIYRIKYSSERKFCKIALEKSECDSWTHLSIWLRLLC